MPAAAALQTILANYDRLSVLPEDAGRAQGGEIAGGPP
jgi:hypothetical protein